MYSFLVIFLFKIITISGQQSDSLLINNKPFRFEKVQAYIPVGLMGAAMLTTVGGKESLKHDIVEERNEHLFSFRNHLDDYAQFAPHIAVYAMDWLGLKPRTDLINRSAIMIKGEVLTLGLSFILKKVTNQTRPDGKAYSFPSGHTANAFAGATMLSLKYGQGYRWVPYAAYVVASCVGVMRLANNKHYLSDVLFGAGLGILTMKAAYWTHKKFKRCKKRSDGCRLYEVM